MQEVINQIAFYLLFCIAIITAATPLIMIALTIKDEIDDRWWKCSVLFWVCGAACMLSIYAINKMSIGGLT